MLIKYKERYSTLVRIISLAVVCLFIYNDLAFALAPKLFVTQGQMRNEYLLKSFLLSHDAVNKYIGTRINPDSLINVDITGLDCYRPDNMVVTIGELEEEQPIGIVAIEGLLKNTGQLAHLGLGNKNGLPVIYVDTQYFYTETVISHEKDKISKWEALRNLKGLTYAEMRRWIKRCIDHPDPVEKKTSRQIAELIHSKSLNHDKINKLYEDIRRKYSNFIEAGLDDEARALLDMAKMFELYKDAEYTLDKDDIDINIAAHESPAGPDISKIDPLLEGLIRDNSFIELFNKAVKKNTDVPKFKIAPLLESCVKTDDISVLRYDDATLLVVSKEGKPYRIVRYASNLYVDYLSAPRLDPNESHLANILSNGFKFELLRDRPEVLADYIDDITMYYENPILRPIVDEISSGEYYNLREAILHLRGIAYEFKGSSDEEHKKIGQHALKLLHSLMYHENKGIRVEANRVLHDIYTDRPEDFPPTKSYKTVLQGQPQTIEVACRKGEMEGRIQWSINGVMQEPIKMSRSKDGTKFSAVVPVDTGTMHYAVEVNLSETWRYKVGLGNESQVSGVIKTQKDMRGKHILEVRTAIFDLAKGEDGKPVWNKDGSLSISNFDQLRKLLPELKKRYDAIWLMDCFEWGPVRHPGKDPSSFAPIDHITIAASLGGEESLDRLRQEAKSTEKKIDLIHNLIPHISQSNTTLPVYFPVYRFDGPRLVRHDSSDGQGDWDDSFQPNWRRKEVLDRYESMVMRLAKKGDSFRADVAHAFDTTFQVDNSAIGMARIFGDIVTNQRRDNGDGCFKTTDLSGTGEPNVILSRLAYEIQANAPNSLIYGENFATKTEDRGWQANDERLIKSGVVPYNSLHEELAHVLRDSRDVSVIIDHMLYRKWVHDQFGGQDVTVYASHDYQRDPQIPDEIYRDRPPLQLYGDGIIPFMASIFLLDYHGPILWHFARLLGDENDDFNKRHNLSLAEFWKIWVNNIRDRDLYEGSVQASLQYLKENPNLAKLGDYVEALKKMLEEYDAMKSADMRLERHGSDCMSVLKMKGDEAVLGIVNYGYHVKDISRQLMELPEIKDDEVFELKEVFRYRKDGGLVSGASRYVAGRELRSLGIHETLRAWETVVYSIKPVKAEKYSLGTILNSMATYKSFGAEDRVKESFVSTYLQNALEKGEEADFREMIVKLIRISKNVNTVGLGDVATVLYDIAQAYPKHKSRLNDYMTRIALEGGLGTDMGIRYDAVKVLRGMQIGEVALLSLEARDIAGLGGLALYIKDIGTAFVDLGLDTTIFTGIFNNNREGHRILEAVINSAKLSYAGRSVTVPFYGESPETIDRFNRAYIYGGMLGGKVRTYALQNDRYMDVLYGGATAEDLMRRYRFFSLGALEAIRAMNIHPAVIQTNEGATGLAMAYLTQPEYSYLINDPHFNSFNRPIELVHVGHNSNRSYQNIVMADNEGDKKHLMRIGGLNPDRYEDHMLVSEDARSLEINPTHAANVRSDHSVTVSPGYRDHTATYSGQLGISGEKLAEDRYLGVQNGIDAVTWQKRLLDKKTFFECKDKAERMRLFEEVSKKIKPAAKKELQATLGLKQSENSCIFTMLHRLCEQKGYEIAIDSIRELLDNSDDAQVVIGGPAEDSDQGRYFVREIIKIQDNPRYRGRFKYVGGVNPNSRLYELMYLGADVFLMPSKFEPAGLSQLEALAAGAVVVARDIDGLSTSIIDVEEAAKKGVAANGFKFFDFTSAELTKAMDRALVAFKANGRINEGQISDWNKLVYNALTYDSRWIRPAKQYINDIYASKTGVDMERTTDFPELLLIFREAEECQAQWGRLESVDSLEKRLIEHGYNTDRGLDYVLEDAVKELKRITDDTEMGSPVKELAKKYYERYRSYLPATVSGMRTTDRSDEIIDAGPGTRFYKTPEDRAATSKNAIENPRADYASARRMVEELLDLYNNMESLAKDANKTEDTAHKAVLKKYWIGYLGRIKDICDSIGIKAQEWDEYSYYKKELERVGNHISTLYGDINRAFESDDKDSLFRLNQQLIDSNRKRMKYQLKAALLIAEGKSGLKDPKMIRNAACKAVQGGLYSCQRLVEELSMRGARLETMAKMYEFRLGDLDLQIERGYGDKEVYRKKGWIRVGSRLVRARRSFKTKKYDDAVSTLAVLSDVYSGKALQMPEKYREALELINGLIGWVRDVSLGRSPPDSKELSYKIKRLNALIGGERHKVWQVIETKSILTVKIDTIKSVQLQFIEASRVKTFLEYYIERINWALQTKAGRLSKRSRQMILTGLVNVQEWLEAGMVDEKHESAQDMGPAIDYLKREQDRAAKESLVRIRERIGKRAADLDAQRQALEKQISERKAPLQSASQAAPTAEENMPGPASGQISFALRCKLVQELITSQPGLAENITALIAAVTEQRPSVLEGVREADFTAYVQRILASIKEDEGFLFYTASEPPPMADMLSGLSYEDKMELSEDLGLTYLLQKAGVNEANKSVVECIRNAAVELKSGAPDTFNVYRLKFTSTYKTLYPENQTVLANYYVPKEVEKPFPTVVVASHMSRDAISRPISLYLVRNGFAVLEVTLPFYGSRTPREAMSTTPINGFFALDFDTKFYLEFFEQSVADMNQAVLWLRTRPEADKERIGIVGQSKAGTVASLVYSTNEYVKYLAAVSPLVDHAASIWDVKEEYIVRDWLEKKGVTRDSFAEATRSVRPSYIASKGKKDPNNILLAASEKDNITPFAYVEDLWFALGRPRIIVLDKEAHSKVDHLFGFMPNMHELFPSIANLFKQAPAPQAAQKTLLGNLDELERMLNKAEQLASRFERKDISPKEASAYLQRLVVMVEDNAALIERNTGSSPEINKLATGIADIYYMFNLYDDARMKSDIAHAREKARMIRSLLLPAPAADANAETPYKVTLQKIGAESWRSICGKGTYDFTVVEAGPKTPGEIQQAFHRFIKKNFPNEDADWLAREAFEEYRPERKYLLLCKGEVVGYYQMWYVSTLQNIYVEEPDYRGTGAADVLVQHILEYMMKGNKDKKIIYHIMRDHRRAIQGPSHSGTIEDLRRELGLNSIVEILPASQTSPQATSVVGVTQLVPVRNFGKTGLSFPVLGIGTVWFGRQWPPDDSSYAYPEFGEVRNYLDGVFADLGNNSRAIMIDTAAAYGSTEEVIGRYFRERPDLFSKAFIATKWGEEYDISTGKSDIDHSKERLIASTKRSLERLGKMDLLYIHGATLEVLSNGEVMEEMRRMKDVHYGGLSLIGASISREDVLERSVRENLIEGLDVIQMPGSVFLNRPDLVNAIYEKGIAIVINSPIRKGDKRTPGAIYADLLGHRELAVILTGTRHHLRDNIGYCLPEPQAEPAPQAASLYNEELRTAKVLVLAGPSGAGKSTFLNRMIKSGENRFYYPPLTTNRKPRDSEKEGAGYHFVDDKTFLDMEARGEIILARQGAVYRYGTFRKYLQEIIDASRSGKITVLETNDAQVIDNMKQVFPALKVIAILPAPLEDFLDAGKRISLEEDLSARLRGRSSMSQDELNRRLRESIDNAPGVAKIADLVVVNKKGMADDAEYEKFEKFVTEMLKAALQAAPAADAARAKAEHILQNILSKKFMDVAPDFIEWKRNSIPWILDFANCPLKEVLANAIETEYKSSKMTVSFDYVISRCANGLFFGIYDESAVQDEIVEMILHHIITLSVDMVATRQHKDKIEGLCKKVNESMARYTSSNLNFMSPNDVYISTFDNEYGRLYYDADCDKFHIGLYEIANTEEDELVRMLIHELVHRKVSKKLGLQYFDELIARYFEYDITGQIPNFPDPDYKRKFDEWMKVAEALVGKVGKDAFVRACFDDNVDLIQSLGQPLFEYLCKLDYIDWDDAYYSGSPADNVAQRILSIPVVSDQAAPATTVQNIIENVTDVKPRIKVIVLDWDGTIVDTLPFDLPTWGIIYARIMKGEGRDYMPPEEDMAAGIEFLKKTSGASLYEQIAMIRAMAEERGVKNLRSVEEYVKEKNALVAEAVKRQPKESIIIRNSLQFLKELRRRGFTGKIIQTSGAPYTLLGEIVDFTGLRGMFDEVYGSYPLEMKEKPHDKAELIRSLKARYNLSDDQIVMIGDGISDVKQAKAAGAVAVGIVSDVRSETEFKASGADLVIRAEGISKDIIPFLGAEFAPAPQAAPDAAAEDEKLKGKGSPADLLELIKNTPELMRKALDWKGLGGITEQDIAKVSSYSERTIRRELKTLDTLRILVQASRTDNYRFDRKMLGPDIDHTKTLINAINDIRYIAGKQGDEKPMHRGAIDLSKMGTVKALVKMAVFKELNNGYLPTLEKDKILWHIIERGVIPREQGDAIVTQINKAFRNNDLPERVWILDENKNTSEAIAEIREKFPNSIIDVALASKDSINKMPDDDQVKMLVFRGCHDFVQLEGVIAALRALHSQDALARLRHIYLIMTDHIFAGELPSASDSIKEFARKFAFDLPPAENAPINDIPELNKRLLALLTAA